MTPTTPDHQHSDPANWKLGTFYFCRADRRIVVPKRIRGLGWTVNFAQPMAVPVSLAVILAALGVVKAAAALGATREVLLTIKLLLAFAVIGFCHYLANRPVRAPAGASPPVDREPKDRSGGGPGPGGAP